VRGKRRQQLAQQLKVKYDAGASIRDLAVETGRSYGSIHRLLHEADVAFRGRGGSRNRSTVDSLRSRERGAPCRIAPSQRAELAAKLKGEYEATKWSIGSLAEKHGLSYGLVRKLLHEAGADVRQGAHA